MIIIINLFPIFCVTCTHTQHTHVNSSTGSSNIIREEDESMVAAENEGTFLCQFFSSSFFLSFSNFRVLFMVILIAMTNQNLALVLQTRTRHAYVLITHIPLPAFGTSRIKSDLSITTPPPHHHFYFYHHHHQYHRHHHHHHHRHPTLSGAAGRMGTSQGRNGNRGQVSGRVLSFPASDVLCSLYPAIAYACKQGLKPTPERAIQMFLSVPQAERNNQGAFEQFIQPLFDDRAFNFGKSGAATSKKGGTPAAPGGFYFFLSLFFRLSKTRLYVCSEEVCVRLQSQTQ
jgi:hypothetical protein